MDIQEWTWRMDYCQRHNASPGEQYWWDKAGIEYERHLEKSQ